uniref:Uncharacterized protein n=1 Tax=Anguilla anguilla TaxID=7936 RepID=A0A0E9W7S8_ANGAN
MLDSRCFSKYPALMNS